MTTNEWGLAERPAQGLGQAATTTPPSTTTTTTVGVLLGAAVGALGGRALKKKHTVVGGVIGAAVGGGAGYYYGKSQQPAATPSGTPTIPAGQNGTINPLMPCPQGSDSPCISQNVSTQGGVMSITLPPAPARLGSISVAAPVSETTSGATYNISAGNAPSSGSTSGVLLTGQNTITITWTDKNNNDVKSIITVNVG